MSHSCVALVLWSSLCCGRVPGGGKRGWCRATDMLEVSATRLCSYLHHNNLWAQAVRHVHNTETPVGPA